MTHQEKIAQLILRIEDVLNTDEPFDQSVGETVYLAEDLHDYDYDKVMQVTEQDKNFCFGCHLAILTKQHHNSSHEVGWVKGFKTAEDCAEELFDYDPLMPDLYNEEEDQVREEMYEELKHIEILKLIDEDPRLNYEDFEDVIFEVCEEIAEENARIECNQGYTREEIAENTKRLQQAYDDVDSYDFDYSNGEAWFFQQTKELKINEEDINYIMWACGTDAYPFSSLDWDETPEKVLENLKKIKRIPNQEIRYYAGYGVDLETERKNILKWMQADSVNKHKFIPNPIQ